MSIYRLGALVAVTAFVAACNCFKKDKGKGEAPAKSPTPIYGKDDFVLIPKTDKPFMMGSERGDSDEKPVHPVTLTKDYYLLAFEVPQKDYQSFALATNREMPNTPNFLQGENRPMVDETWEEARAYCQWAGGDLPTEAQWERAALGGDGKQREFATQTGGSEGVRYNAGSTVDVKANTGNQLTWGGKVLYHMSGNVWEWVLDRHGDYPSDHLVDPKGPPKGWNRVLRGGSWFVDRENTRAAVRFHYNPDDRYDNGGFRCAFVP